MATVATATPLTQDVNLVISLSDMSVLGEIKKALKLFRGVEKVRTMKAKNRAKELSGIQEAIQDVEDGRVTHWNSVDEMFDTLMKE